MRRIIGIISLMVLSASVAQSQGLSPIVLELKADKHGHASGEFKVINSGVVPLASVIELKAFAVSPDGQVSLRPMDATTHVTLSQTSAKVPPMSAYDISFNVDCVTPCAFQLIAFASNARKPTDGGVVVRTGIGSAIYVYQHEPLTPEDLKVSFTDTSHLRIENLSAKMGRAINVESKADGKWKQQTEFPIFPHTVRVIELGDHVEDVKFQVQRGAVDARP